MQTTRTSATCCAAALGVLAFATAWPALAAPEFNLRGRLHMDYAIHDEDQVPLSTACSTGAPASACRASSMRTGPG
jgi:hypothetical protein